MAFPSTRWTLILSARESPERRRAALNELLGDYWRPLYSYARRKGCDPEAAQDAVQGFVTHLLGRDFISRLDPARGRLRSYLRTSLDNYLANVHERETAHKRGGNAVMVPLDIELAERTLTAAPTDAEDAFDHEWALVLMERALERLRREFDSGQRKAPFEAVADFFRAGEVPSYKEIATRHGMTLPQLKSLLHRTRLRFRELMAEEAADIVAGQEDAAVEVTELLGRLRA